MHSLSVGVIRYGIFCTRYSLKCPSRTIQCRKVIIKVCTHLGRGHFVQRALTNYALVAQSSVLS